MVLTTDQQIDINPLKTPENKKVVLDKPMTFSIVEAESLALANQLEEYLNNTAEPDFIECRNYAVKAATLQKSSANILKSCERSAMEQLYPSRGDVYKRLKEVTFRALAEIPFNQLNPTEQVDYVSSLSYLNGEHFREYSNGYYFFGWGEFVEEIPQESKDLNSVINNSDIVLTTAQEDAIAKWQASTYKVHLSVPKARKLEILKLLLKLKKEDSKLAKVLIAEKKLKGERESVRFEELKSRGGKLVSLQSWKMKNYTPADRLADFVIFVEKSKNSPIEKLTDTINELSVALSGLDLKAPVTYPRYSSPIPQTPWLSIVQGDGSFKDYLLRTGGEDKLGKYYDKSTNYAFAIKNNSS